MGLAIWCDLKDNGHAFDEREAIIVAWKDDIRYHCRAHCMRAFSAAFHAAHAAGEADIFLPDLGQTFTVRAKPRTPREPGTDSTAPDGKLQQPSDRGDAGKPLPEEYRQHLDDLIRMIETGPGAGGHRDSRLDGIMVLCCDGTEEGHAFDEREALTVSRHGGHLNFCKEHRIAGFVAAFGTARSAGEAELRIAQLGGSFTIRPEKHPADGNGQPGEGRKPEVEDEAPPPRRPEQARNYGRRA